MNLDFFQKKSQEPEGFVSKPCLSKCMTETDGVNPPNPKVEADRNEAITIMYIMLETIILSTVLVGLKPTKRKQINNEIPCKRFICPPHRRVNCCL